MKSKKEQFELKAMEWANNRCVNWMMLFDGGELGWLFFELARQMEIDMVCQRRGD